MIHTNQSQSDQASTAVRVHCPHCDQPIDVSSVVLPPPTTNSANNQADTASPFLKQARTWGTALGRYLFPVSGAFASHQRAEEAGDGVQWRTALRHHWKLFVAFIAGVVIICLGLIWWGRPIGTGPASAVVPTNAIQPTQSTPSGASEATKAAIIDTLTQYNRAETEAAALLTITPLQPLLEPDGPLAQRRAAQLAERQRRGAPHHTMLLRWAVGEVAVVDTTATVVTQETWSNGEKDAVAPEQATVRVTYTLRWEGQFGRWLIVDSSHVAL